MRANAGSITRHIFLDCSALAGFIIRFHYPVSLSGFIIWFHYLGFTNPKYTIKIILQLFDFFLIF